jgi:ABC-type sugar transport system permease subunit
MTQAVNEWKTLGSEYPPPKFISDRWITGVAMAFLLAFLIFFMLYPVYDICRLSFFKEGVLTLKNYSAYFTNPRISVPDQ